MRLGRSKPAQPTIVDSRPHGPAPPGFPQRRLCRLTCLGPASRCVPVAGDLVHMDPLLDGIKRKPKGNLLPAGIGPNPILRNTNLVFVPFLSLFRRNTKGTSANHFLHEPNLLFIAAFGVVRLWANPPPFNLWKDYVGFVNPSYIFFWGGGRRGPRK